jgi:ferredoxin/flavodoxin---NADP+ reductase
LSWGGVWWAVPPPPPPNATPERVDALLAERRPDVVTVDAWRAIDAHELRRGAETNRPRVKLASREELLAAAGRADPA